MPQLQDLKSRAQQARAWMLGVSFPFWADKGLHSAGGFQERLDLRAEPLDDHKSRVRLQARQTFCFALAQKHGWDKARCEALVARGIGVLTQQCMRADGLLGKQVHLGAGLSDDRADLYDTAFALLAFSTAAQTGNLEAETCAAALSAAIDTHLRRPASEGGYKEALPQLGHRLQNPHMHLFEASLAYYSVSKDSAALDRTRAIQGFVADHFFDERTGRLHEVKALDGSAHSSDRLEAGHHYEWAWLLHRHAQLTGDDVHPMAKALYDTAVTLTDETGRIALSHMFSGAILEPVYRTWGQTEALKAHIAACEQGWIGLQPITRTFDLMWADHVALAPRGAWIDRVDSQGRPTAQDITAATGYHLYVAFEELIRLADSL